MNATAAGGLGFGRAYTTNPVCVPARIGVMTANWEGIRGDRYVYARYTQQRPS